MADPGQQTLTIQQAIDLALHHHKAGDLPIAEGIFQQILQAYPNQPVALHLLGVIAHQVGKNNIAVDHITKALTIKADYDEAHSNLGLALHDLGRLDEAVTSYHKALAINPDLANAHYNLGITLNELNKLDEAVACYQKAISLKSNYAESHYNLGNALTEQGKLEDAVVCYQKAISLKSDYADAFNNLWFALRPMCHEITANSRDRICIERIIDSLPTPPEPDIIRFQFKSLFGENSQKAWLRVIDNLPTIQIETICNAKRSPISPITSPEKTFERRMVGLLHFGRSGSGYLHSLLDGHPNVSTLPGAYMSGFFGREVWNRISSDGFQGVPEQFSRLYEVLFDARCPNKIPPAFFSDSYANNSVGVAEGFTQMGKKRDTPLTLERGQFLENLGGIINDLENINHGQLFEAIHHAYEKTLGNNFSDKRLIFYHLHQIDPYSLAKFLRYFPKAQLLMIIRNPLKSCESWILKIANTDQINGYKIYDKIINIISMMMMDLNCPAFQTQDSAAICLEDIKTKPKETMRRLCIFLGIEDAASLYESTMQGLKWWGDPSSKLYGRTHDTESWEDDPIRAETGALFSATDQLILGTLFYPLNARFGYVGQSDRQFKNDLKKVSALLYKPLDFEMKLAKTFPRGYPDLEETAPFKSFHAVLMGMWRTLDQYGTYPYMLKSLPEY